MTLTLQKIKNQIAKFQKQYLPEDVILSVVKNNYYLDFKLYTKVILNQTVLEKAILFKYSHLGSTMLLENLEDNVFKPIINEGITNLIQTQIIKLKKPCKIIAVDFDGTCVTHAYPNIGLDIGALKVLQRLIMNGHKIILWTMRSNTALDEAVNWCERNHVKLYAVNENPEQKDWTSSQKAYAHIYIDDAALGIPLIIDKDISDRPFVDWCEVEKLLEYKGYLPKDKYSFLDEHRRFIYPYPNKSEIVHISRQGFVK